MQVFDRVSALTSWLDRQRLENRSIGFVPTMGALHNGHLSLVQNARKGCDIVVASIFVNPTQFNDPSDLEHYPRQEAQDQAMLEAEGCDAVLVPSVGRTSARLFPPSRTYITPVGFVSFSWERLSKFSTLLLSISIRLVLSLELVLT